MQNTVQSSTSMICSGLECMTGTETGSTSGQLEIFHCLFHCNGTETARQIQASYWGLIFFNELCTILLSSGECVYLDFEGKWKGRDCRATQVRAGGLYAVCKRPEKVVESSTQNSQETTGGVVIVTSSKNETKEASDEDEGFFLTDEVLISLALIQLPAVILAFLGIIKAFHKHGCTRKAPFHVFKASLLVFFPFFAIELVGAVFELLGWCLGVIPCSRVIRKTHQVEAHSMSLHLYTHLVSNYVCVIYFKLRCPTWLLSESFTSKLPSIFLEYSLEALSSLHFR